MSLLQKTLFSYKFDYYPLGYSMILVYIKKNEEISSLNVRDHVWQLYSTTGKIIVLFFLILNFFERSLEDNRVWTEY